MWQDVPPGAMGSELEANVPYLSEQVPGGFRRMEVSDSP